LQVIVLSLLCVFFLWRGVAVWKATVVIFVGSVAWTWVHMYKLALSRKQATLSKLAQVPKQCLVEKQVRKEGRNYLSISQFPKKIPRV
jgi:uracil-DNA glycosylase